MIPRNELAFFYPEGHQAHQESGHPERPERVEAVRQALQVGGWWEAHPLLEPLAVPVDLLQAVHAPSYLERLQAACQTGQRLDMDTYTTPASWDVALKNAGGALAAAETVWKGKSRRAFALTRPPGHHATPSRGMGFCLLNNVALACQHLIQNEAASRLAVIDLDLHHGNGTQDIFWRRGDVFYISTHQSPLYPGSGRLEEVGEGAGEGKNANFSLPPGSGDQAFWEVTNGLILPLLDRFEAQMLLVSFGFDPHWRDPLGSLQLSAGRYGEIIGRLAAWTDQHCSGKIALFLEGGYDLLAAAACGQAAAAALVGEPWQDPLGPSPRPEGRSWTAVVRQARAIWEL